MDAVIAIVLTGALGTGITLADMRMETMDRAMKECRLERTESGRVIVWDTPRCGGHMLAEGAGPQ